MFRTVRIKTDSFSADSFSSRWRLALAASGAVLLAAALLCSRGAAFRQTLSVYADVRGGIALRAAALAQEGEDDDQSPIPPEQIEKYVAVYKAMQQNHNLSIDQAAAAQGLSVGAFRDIESQIERDDLIRERVRQALRPGGDSSDQNPSGSSTHKPTK